MPNKNSDFKREFSDLYELLPEVFKSQVNESVFNNVLNRYFSKPEIERVNGFIGQVPPSLENRLIQEPTPHRQGYQLQPLLFSRIGSENYIASYVDILNELERLGVDPCRQKIWGSAQVFNWVPPIDIDKLINYRDYYWVDNTDPTSQPQYITIENRCAKAEQLVAGYQLTLDTYGEDFDIVGIDTTEDAFVIDGDLRPVFTDGFVFFVRGSTNADINNKFFTTASSTFDTGTNQTTIFVDEDIVVNTPIDGVVSIIELKSVFLAQQTCACDGDVGWDQAPWDDNQIGSIVWTTGLLSRISFDTEANWLAGSPDNIPGDTGSLWYDVDDDILYQNDAVLPTTNWIPVVNNFSVVLDLVKGTHFWDFTQGCEVDDNQWIQQNKWLHKNAVTNLATAKQATLPIIEYDARVQLNEWNFTDYIWKYRESEFVAFNETDAKPTLNELYPFSYLITGASEITLSPTVGDQTEVFVPGYEFRVINDPDNPANDGTYTVVSSTFSSTATITSNALQTVIQVAETFPTLSTPPQTTGQITPHVTSQGDNWRSYDEHWVLVDTLEQVAITPQITNMFVDPDPLATPVVVGGVGQYVLSPLIDASPFGETDHSYSMEWTVTSPGVTTLNFDASMIGRARGGENDLRVYLDGIRQYGQFVEDLDINGDVDAITFDNPIPVNSTVRIEAGEPGLLDVGRHSIDVRTIEDNAQFLIDGTEQLSLIRYRKSEQVKTDVHQYPLFDIVNVDGTDTFTANHIFGFLTSQDAPVNAATGLRIVIDDDQNFNFEQLILEEDNGKMYAFLLNNEVQTIWRAGNNDEEYVPEYVDADRNPVPVGDPNGFWEIPDQLYFNSEHENRQQITYREIFTHFNSIIGEQASIPGFILPGDTFYLLLDPNYGLGGRIKEHNFSYDTLLSSTFVDNVTPLGVIDFAHDQYLNSLNTLKELYRSNLVSYLTNTSNTFIQDFTGSIVEDVIDTYEINDYLAFIFGDSNTYDASTDTGVRNWPATLPYIRMAFKREPYLIEDETLDIDQLIHHDGHRSTPALAAATKESVIQITLNTLDTRVSPAEPLGQQAATPPPDTYTDLELTTTPRSGIYWYEVVGGVRTLYRFNVVAVSNTPPVDVTTGALWYDTNTDTLRELSVGLTWDPVTAVGDEIITSAWTEIDLDNVLANLLLDVETRLFEQAPDLTDLAFDVSTLPSSTISCPDINPTITEEDTYNLLLQEAFGSWLRDQEIDDPYSAINFYNSADPFTWNYKQSVISTYPRGPSQAGITGGWWEDLYNKLYRTPYPHLEPWKLQGYNDKPDWWDTTYLDTSGTRRWIYDHGTTTGMWENIRVGSVPAGQLLPNGNTSTGAPGETGFTYNYFSVNIDDVTLDGYEPDDLFPPYWDHIANGGSAVVRTVIANFAQVVAASADYQFGDAGPVEFEWSQTAQRLYDDLTVSFKMRPVEFFHSTFGEEFIDVAGLNVSVDLCKVYSHKDVRFHGDITNVNEVLQFEGLNQWYVNFNRASGFDTTSSNFRPLWANWNPLLSYQFGSVIDTATLQIDNPNFDVNARDYRIALKTSRGIDNLEYDGLKVSVLRIPNKLITQDTEALWTFQVDTFAPEVSSLEYYNVRNYPVKADTLNNDFTLYQFSVTDVDDLGGVFTIAGNQTEAFTLSNDFTITKSTGNNGSYTATNVVYDSVNNTTLVSVGAPLPDPTADGLLTASYRTLPWQTGDVVEISSTSGLPSPLLPNTQYYVIRLTNTRFQLAATPNDATTGTPINLNSAGQGDVKVGEISYKFVARDGEATDRQWAHYVLDTENLLSLTPPTNVYGVQNLINFIDGYARVEKDEGFEVNYDNTETDIELNRPISWETEQERFIDNIFRLRSFRTSVPERFAVTTDNVNDWFEFSAEVPEWTTGLKVQIGAFDGTVPTPFVPNTPYYLIVRDDGRVQLALTRTNALLGNAVDILSTGAGDIFLAEYQTGRFTIETFEINPARNNLWVRTPQGILADISAGNTADTRGIQLITDQNGNQLTTEELAVYRLDKISRINVQSTGPNPEIPAQGQDPLRDYVHISSANLFIDGVEHVIIFNDDSVEGFLIYDPFLGLNTARFEMLFFRQDEFTQRPVVGGYFLTEDEQLLRNIEASTLDLQFAYDTYQVLETTDITKESRRALGYDGIGTQDYLTELNVTPKSQFAFWRGFIASKGSTTGIDAYTNSRTFAGAKVDEVWAFKVAEFGSPRQKVYPELKLFEVDGQRVEKRLEFLDETMERFEADSTFDGVFLTDQNRWLNQPNQLALLSDNFNTLYFDAEITSVEIFNTIAPNGPSNWTYETETFFDEVVLIVVDPVAETVSHTFTEGVDFEIVNGNLLRFSSDPNAFVGPGEEFRLYTINPARSALNPAKIIDVEDDIVIRDVPIWDPRRGYHYHNAYNIVDIDNEDGLTDPAVYNTSPDPNNVGVTAWSEPEVGTVWWDTSIRSYKPYNDKNIFNLQRRTQTWGQLEDWSEVKLYQWTESDLPPEEYDAQAAIETTDITIDPRIRKSGTAKADIFRRERSAFDVDSVNVSNATVDPNTIFINDPSGDVSVGDRIVFTTTDNLPSPLEVGTFYFVTFVDVPSATRGIRVSLTEGGSDVEIDPGALVIDIGGAASVITTPTYLLNDFGTAGFQEAQYNAGLTSGQSTNYLTGTNGTGTVDLNPAQAGVDTPYAASDYGTGASVLIVDPSAVPAATAGVMVATRHYVAEVEVDGFTANVRYTPGANPVTYAQVAAEVQSQVNTQLASRGASVTVTIENNVGIRITSNQAVVGGYVNTTTDETGATDIRNLWRDATNTDNSAAIITVPSAGLPIAEKSGSVTIDTTNIFPISFTADEAPTYDDLIDIINDNIGTFGTASLTGGDIVVTSATTGVTSNVTLTGDMFTDLVAFNGFSSTAGTSFTYGAEFTIDGSTVVSVTFEGDLAPTVGDVIDQLNDQLTGAFADIDGSNIVVSSTSIGINSSISITEPVGGTLPLFDDMDPNGGAILFTGFGVSTIGTEPQQYTVDVTVGNQTQNIIVTGNQVQTYGELLNEINNDLAAGEIAIDLNGNLIIQNGAQQVTIQNDELFQYLSTIPPVAAPPTLPASPAVVDIFNIDTGVGTHQVVPSFQDEWVQLRPNIQQQIVAQDRIPATNPASVTYQVSLGPSPDPNDVVPGDVLDVYVNGTFSEQVTVGPGGTVGISAPLPDEDFITFVKPVPELTQEEIDFDPDAFDDGSFLVERKELYNYTVRNTVNKFGETTQTYFFWVEDKTTRVGNNPSLIVAERELTTIPTPYLIIDKAVDADVSAGGSPLIGIPQRYTQAIVKGLAGIINDDDRYILRFTKDFTLRDELRTRNFPSDLTADFSRVKQEPLDLKNLHAEWTLLREGQPFKIPRNLWDKITEAVIGRELANPTVRVPSLERELYDLQFDTQTRFGFDAGQAFVDGQLAFATVIDDLEDPNNDFAPVDINSFFQSNDTVTETGLIAFFDNIYNTFSVEDVNRIYFKVLLDALSKKDKYPGVFKTSWVSLEGTQVLLTEDLVNG